VRFLEKPNKTLLSFSQFNCVEVFVLKDPCCTQSPKSKASLDAAAKASCSVHQQELLQWTLNPNEGAQSFGTWFEL
jgi:hypothetical protein